MAFPKLNQGGAFKAPSTAQGYNHGHASAMAHAANRKVAVAKALSSLKAPAAPPAGAVPPPPMDAPTIAHVAHHAATKHGVHATAQGVHKAIDSLMAKGRFTPLQGAALKQGNGPLMGPPGQTAMNDIANAMKGPM